MPPRNADETFEAFRYMLNTDALVSKIVVLTGTPRSQVENLVHTSLEEAKNALRLLWPVLPNDPTSRLLEIGSGIGILTHLLASMGYQVIGLEPGAVGYEIHQPLAHAVGEALSGEISRLDIGAEELNPVDHGKFDFIYSINVIEHVVDVDAVLAAACSVLVENGKMLHSCPNYVIPYEPHFALPLLPFRPASTARILPNKITESGLWKSLNFITIRQVRQHCRRQGLDVEFHTGQMARALRRLATDSEFATRHGALVPVAKVLHRVGVLAVLERLPAGATTPMVFVVSN